MSLPAVLRRIWLDNERLRYLVALLLALLTVLMLFSLPLPYRPSPVRIAIQPSETIQLEPERRPELRPVPEAPATRWQAIGPEAPPEPSTTPAETLRTEAASATERAGLQALAPEEVLDFAQEQPDIVGGLRALYLRIQYPRAAREQGIEGRVILEFIVEKDGTPSHIRVLQSAHPLLDSAAVQALRATTFVPGRQHGQPVRVRMRLPIRFQLLDKPRRTDSTRTPTGQHGGTIGRDVVPLMQQEPDRQNPWKQPKR